MKYAIELYFDPETERKLFHLVQRVAEEKLSTRFLEWKTRPHLTLACFNDVEEQNCIRQLQAFAQCHRVIPACIGSIGMFPDTKTVFAAPVMTRDMYRLQARLHACLKDCDTTGWEWYCPDRWVPHCTLALTGDEDDSVFYRTSDLLLHEFQKMSGEYTAIGLVKVTCPVSELYTAELCR